MDKDNAQNRFESAGVADIYRALGTGARGLTQADAAGRLADHGKNTLSAKKKRGFFMKLLLSFGDAMTIVLFAAAAVSFVVSFISGETAADAFIILAIVILNSIISVIQESKAERAIEALKSLSAPTVTVIRDGMNTVIASADVVPGDIVLLEKGGFVPADCRLTESFSLVTDESALTGEPHGVYKDALPHGDNAVWAGTAVTGGHGKGVVTETGMRTRMGKIAAMLDTAEEKTPLQKRLSKTGTGLGNAAIGICAVIFVISLLRGFAPAEMFLTSVGLAVAAIPEGLPAIVTIMLSIGVTAMAKRKAVVRKLPAVETLGSATVICSDKTGTLTVNRLSVTDFEGDKAHAARLFALNNRLSSPTEQALYDFALSVHKNAEAMRAAEPIIEEVPFDPKLRLMATLHKKRGGGYLAVLKGAPEALAPYTAGSFGGISRMTSRGLRVMAVAFAETDTKPTDLLSLSYSAVGVAGMADTPRPEAKDAIRECKRAGIRVVMITGDHRDTAAAIAAELGITGDVITQAEVEALPEAERRRALTGCAVFARSAPEFKVTIIDALKASGEVVAMTGDGVNDAPALKKADIGCAMGKSGTDVAREACDIILTDDNFATIVAAVRLGRGIYTDIRRAVHFLISCNIGEILTVFCAIMMGGGSPLSAVQLLWVNLVTDSLPAIALGLLKPDKDIMTKKPVRPGSPLFSGAEKTLIAVEGLAIGALTLIAYFAGGCGMTGSTMAFGVLSFSQLFHSFNMRTDLPVYKSGFALPTLGAFAISGAAQAAVMFIPALADFFGVVCLSFGQVMTVFGLSAAMFVMGETAKLLEKKKRM